MSKSSLFIIAPLLIASAAAAPAAIVGQDAAACRSGKPSVLVRVSGFKRAGGTVRIGVYPAGSYLQKSGTVSKDTLAVRSRGPMDVCLSVPRPGRYAIAIHHDLNGNDDKDMSDGVGYSNNPRLSLTNLKPSFGRTALQVGQAPKRTAVVLQYRKGLSIGPVEG